MSDDTAAALTEVADHLAAASARLHDLAVRDEEPASDPEAEADFLRGAKRELDALIREAEGDGPWTRREKLLDENAQNRP